MIIVDQNASGQTINLQVGQVMELRLAENPTTGFRWRLVADGAPVCVVANDRFEGSPGPPGHGGQHTWEIRGVAAGDCDIAMQHRRPPDSLAGSFALHVHVTP